MNSYSDKKYSQKVYEPQLHKTFDSAVISFLEREFPHLTGPLTRKTFVDALKVIVEQFYQSATNLKVGQMLWVAVAKDEKPSYGKKMSSTRLVPVILTAIHSSDIEKRMKGERLSSIKKDVIARILKEADAQNAVLSESDAALILQCSLGGMSDLILQYEKEYDIMLPRRGNIHDMGRTVSHKREIVKKIKIDGKSPSKVALETTHSLESVDRYTSDFERVNFCLKKGLTVDGTTFVTSFTKNLVFEYVGLIQDLNRLKKELEEKQYNELLENPPF